MLYGLWPRKENILVARPVVANFHVVGLKRYELAVAGHARLDHEHAQFGIGQLRDAHVAYLEHEHELTVAFRNDSVVREYDGAFAFVGTRDLGEHDPGHKALHEYTKTRLQHQEENGEGTLFGDVSQAVANRVLGLDRI